MDCNNKYQAQSYENLNGLAIGMSYVPWQKFEQVLDAENGLAHGTIFAELVLPFYGKKAACCGMRGAHE